MKHDIDRKMAATAPFIVLTQSILHGAHWSHADRTILLQCADALDADSDSEELRALTNAIRGMARLLQ
jgi:hypothetical protein